MLSKVIHWPISVNNSDILRIGYGDILGSKRNGRRYFEFPQSKVYLLLVNGLPFLKPKPTYSMPW